MGIIITRRRIPAEWTLKALDLGDIVFIDIIMHPSCEA
jgi:hypothetical protein